MLAHPFRVVRHWHREAVDTLFLEAFKSSLDGILGILTWWVEALPMAWDWNWMIF